MKYRRFFVGFVTWIVITGVLYWIGERFSIRWLMFSYEYQEDGEGFSFSAGSFLPLLIGLALSAIAEKIYARKKSHKKAV